MKNNEKISISYLENKYFQSRSFRPIGIRNLLWVIRHPVFALQMIWFAATILGLLKIDNKNLKKIFKKWWLFED
jgi:hypothetical protein